MSRKTVKTTKTDKSKVTMLFSEHVGQPLIGT